MLLGLSEEKIVLRLANFGLTSISTVDDRKETFLVSLGRLAAALSARRCGSPQNSISSESEKSIAAAANEF